jgi:GR25 family glycosyltransferase involved in LPS biosynthesis
MKAYAIYVPGNVTSERGLEELKLSTNRLINPFPAAPIDAVYEKLKEIGIRWNYPWEGQETDISVGLVKRAYPTKVKEARISCALSHLMLWGVCYAIEEPIMILEHDSIFIKELDFDPTLVNYDIIGLNDPRGATRKSQLYHEKIQNSSQHPITSVPTIDEHLVPQGLAGNSAYIIKPRAAETLMGLVEKHGLWPNDAIMCKQLVPFMGVTKEYYTRVQGLKSTTTQ